MYNNYINHIKYYNYYMGFIWFAVPLLRICKNSIQIIIQTKFDCQRGTCGGGVV